MGRAFGERGYFPIDLIRGRVWQNDAVDWWYAQNTLLFCPEESYREQ